MSPAAISPLSGVKALTFDVFGTVVDWRSSVTAELSLRSFRKASGDLPDHLKERLRAQDEDGWGRFAQEWHDSYSRFTHSFNPERDEWKTIDQHHLESLNLLIRKWELDGVYTESEIESLSLVWHRLEPWADSSEGIQALGKLRTTCTLSNGNLELLQDLDDFGSLGFTRLLSAANFRAYKPNPQVYQGAVRELDCQPGEVAMVAAHLSDLDAARRCGLKTVYIERPREEAWDEDSVRYQQAKAWVDVWIKDDENGIVTLAKKFQDLE